MSQSISVRTPGAHKHHAKQKAVPTCGCATQQNMTPETPVSRCPCGALYLRDVVSTFPMFTCYDCMRAVNIWVQLKELPRLEE